MNAALYARVSSDIQRQERTIESQLFELRKQIARAGHVLVKEYIEDGHSRAERDRPERNDETVYCIYMACWERTQTTTSFESMRQNIFGSGSFHRGRRSCCLRCSIMASPCGLHSAVRKS
jgi:hypothetical protein